jgi:uncharacterized protein YndB with AHSA1/START domain
MSTATDAAPKTATTTQVFRVYIQASPEAIWEAITSPEWNARYGYHSPADYDLRPGGRYEAHATPEMKAMGSEDVVVDGEVIESDPPNRLVQTFRFRFTPEMVEEGFTTLTWEIFAESEKLSRLTVTHDVTDAPITAHQISVSDDKLGEGGGGWSWILADLKSLLETGQALEL